MMAPNSKPHQTTNNHQRTRLVSVVHSATPACDANLIDRAKDQLEVADELISSVASSFVAEISILNYCQTNVPL